MLQVRHVIYVAIHVVNTSKCILRLSWHDYWLIVVSRTHILIITDLNTNVLLNVLMNTRLHIKIYKYQISNLVCTKQTYSTTRVHEANIQHNSCAQGRVWLFFVSISHRIIISCVTGLRPWWPHAAVCGGQVPCHTKISPVMRAVISGTAILVLHSKNSLPCGTNIKQAKQTSQWLSPLKNLLRIDLF